MKTNKKDNWLSKMNIKSWFKGKKLICFISSLVVCLGAIITSSILIADANNNKNVDTSNPSISVNASTTGATEAPDYEKGGFLYLRAGAKYTMTGGTLAGGQNTYGGAVYVCAGAEFTMTGGTIQNCFARYGGAIYVEAGGTCNIIGGQIISNHAQVASGIYCEEETAEGVKAVLNINHQNSLIKDNTYQDYSTNIEVYSADTGVLLDTYSDNNLIFDIDTANTSNAPYTACTGYYFDKELTQPVNEGYRIKLFKSETEATFKSVISALEEKKTVFYTKPVSAEDIAKLSFSNGEVSASSIAITGDIVIPAFSPLGYKVTKIKAGTSTADTNSSFDGCTGITSVFLPTTVITVGEYAFQGCIGLTSFNFNNVNTIGGYSFSNCTGLTNIKITNSVKTLGSSAFGGCSNLNRVDIDDLKAFFSIPSTNPSYSFFISSSIETAGIYLKGELITDLIVPVGVTTIGALMSYNPSLRTVSLPSTVTQLNMYSLALCSNLKKIDLPDTLKIIGDSSFYSTAIEEIVIPDSVVNVNSSAFRGCASLKKVTLSKNLTNLSSEIFNGCTALEEIDVPSSVTAIGSYAFNACESLKKIIIPESVKRIDNNAFSNCTSLKYAYLPSSITTINASSVTSAPFYNCKDSMKIFTNVTSYSTKPSGWGSYWNRLTSKTSVMYAINKSDILEYIDEDWFFIKDGKLLAYMGDETDVVIPSGVISMENNAISYMTNIESVTIQNSVTTIKGSVFIGCNNLVSVTIPDSVTSLNSYSFASCQNLTKFNFSSIDLLLNISGSVPPDGFIYNCSNQDVEIYIDGELLEHLIIPEGTITLGMGFSSYKKLKSITFPDSLKTYSSYALYGCSGLERVNVSSIEKFINIKEQSSFNIGIFTYCGNAMLYINEEAVTDIIIPEGVTSLGNSFYGYKNLNSIQLPSTLEEIGGNAFYYCSNLTNINIPETVSSIGSYAFYGCSNLTNINIPEAVSSIGSYAFYGCSNLTNINIPNAVTAINSYTFYNCTSLENIILPEYVETISSGAFNGCSKLKNIELPANLRVINSNAFSSCTSLRQIFIPSSVETISASSYSSSPFYNCKSTLQIRCGASQKQNGWGAYWNYYASGKTLPTTFSVEENSEFVIKDGVLYEYLGSEKNIVIPEEVGVINEKAFAYRTDLISIFIHSGVYEIIGGLENENSPFWGCSRGLKLLFEGSFETIIMSDDFNFIDNQNELAIEYFVTKDTYLDALTNGGFVSSSSNPELLFYIGEETFVELPSIYLGIGNKAFYYNEKVERIKLHEEVINIGSSAFEGCYSLIRFDFPEDNPTGYEIVVGNNAFAYCINLRHLFIPDFVALEEAVTPDASPFYGCNNELKLYLHNYELNYDAGFHSCWDYCNDFMTLTHVLNSELQGDFINQNTELHAYIGEDEHVVIPDYIEFISSFTFCNLPNLVSIEILDNVIEVFGSIVYNCPNFEEYHFDSIEEYFDLNLTLFEFNNDGYLVIDGERVVDLVVPENINNIPAGAFYGYKALRSLTFASDDIYINENAFGDCYSLKEITFPSGDVYVGYNVFNACNSLEWFTFLKGQNNRDIIIEDGAFAYCSSLKEIDLSDDYLEICDNAFSNCTSLKEIKFDTDYLDIGMFAFEDCTSLEYIEFISESLCINDNAFEMCTSLKTVIFLGEEEECMVIGAEAFYYCESLEVVYLSTSVERIYQDAFVGAPETLIMLCESESKLQGWDDRFNNILGADATVYWGVSREELNNYLESGCIINDGQLIKYLGSSTEFVIPEGVTTVLSTFNTCENVTKLTLPTTLKSYDYIFTNKFPALEELHIKSMKSFVEIEATNPGYSFFTYRSDLKLYENGTLITDVIIPEGVTVLYATFTGSKNLKSITLPTTLTKIFDYALYNCSNLENIEIPNNVNFIGNSAFSGCSSLKDIVIPNSVSTIYGNVFSYCTSLASVYIPASVTTINASSKNTAPFFGAFSGLTIFCETTSKKAGWGTYWNYYSSGDGELFNSILDVYYGVSLDDANQMIANKFVIENGTIVNYIGSDSEVVIPDGVTKIGDAAFANNTSLVSIVIPSTVTDIGEFAFYSCTNLKHITLNEGLKTIANSAFRNCRSLTKLALPNSLETINGYAFNGCSSLTAIYIPSTVIINSSNTVFAQTNSNLTVYSDYKISLYYNPTTKPELWDTNWFTDVNKFIWGVNRYSFVKWF